MICVDTVTPTYLYMSQIKLKTSILTSIWAAKMISPCFGQLLTTIKA